MGLLLSKINPMYAGIAALVVGVFIYVSVMVYGLKTEIAELQLEVKTVRDAKREVEGDLVLSNAQSELYSTAIAQSNDAIEKLATEANIAKEEYDIWYAKPPEVKFDTVYKYLPSKTAGDECKDVLDTLHRISKDTYEDI